MPPADGSPTAWALQTDIVRDGFDIAHSAPGEIAPTEHGFARWHWAREATQQELEQRADERELRIATGRYGPEVAYPPRAPDELPPDAVANAVANSDELMPVGDSPVSPEIHPGERIVEFGSGGSSLGPKSRPGYPGFTEV